MVAPGNVVYRIQARYQDRTWFDILGIKFWGVWGFPLNPWHYRSDRWVSEIYHPAESEDPAPAAAPDPGPPLQPTAVGSDVELSFDDHDITFDTVITEGVTDITTVSSAAVFPGGPVDTALPQHLKESCAPPQYFDVQTTATYAGNIEICFSYDDTGCDDTDLRLLHHEDDSWIDVTDYPVDTANNIICGNVLDLSLFVMVAYHNETPSASCQDVEVPTDPGVCTTHVSVDAGSSDADGDPLTLHQSPEGPYQLGSTEVTLTVSDDQGGAAECIATVTVVDQEAYTLTCPESRIAECAGPDGASVSFSATAEDNCTEAPAVYCDPPSGSGFSLGESTATCTATDNSGSQSACNFTVSVVDSATPTLNVPGDVIVEAEGSAGTAVSTGTATGSDVCCEEATITNSAPSLFPLGETVVTWTATDCNGNISTGNQRVAVVDTTPPEITCPPNLTLECPANTAPEATGSAAATDLVSDVTLTYVDQVNAGCGTAETITRTWSATDAAGNTSSCTQTIVVQDTTTPNLAVPADITVEATVAGGAAATETSIDVFLAGGSSDDTCGAVTLGHDGPAFFPVGETAVEWVATDECGHVTTSVARVTVVDTTPPQIGCPADVTLDCPADTEPATTGVASGSDTASEVSIGSSEEVTQTCGETETIVRSWTAADVAGNTSTCEQTIVLQDVTAPVFASEPADLTVECDSVPMIETVSATDACDADVPVDSNEMRTDGSCINDYVVTRTWNSVDDCGNETVHSQAITVKDTSAPVLSSEPPDLIVECDAVPAVPVITATDNCNADVTVDFSEIRTDGDCADGYVITRAWTATDDCGNETSHVQTTLVRDTTAPVLSHAPSDVIVECDAVPAVPIITATDNCDAEVAFEFSETRADGDCVGNYVLTRTWTVADDCGNQTSHSQTITVLDTIAPVLSTEPSNSVVECDSVPVAETVTATDSCDAAVAVQYAETQTDGNCLDGYLVTRSWTAADECGNETTHVQTITEQPCGDVDGDQLCDNVDGIWFTSYTTHPIVGQTLFRQAAYRIAPESQSVVQTDGFLSAAANMVALDRKPSGNILFAVEQTVTVPNGNKTIRLKPGVIYRWNGTKIRVKFKPSSIGVGLSTINALDQVAGGSYLFSVDEIKILQVDGVQFRLFPGQIWRLMPTGTPKLELVRSFTQLGFDNVDGFDQLPDGRMAISAKENSPGYGIFQQNIYIWDPVTDAVIPSFDFGSFHVDDSAGFTLLTEE